MADTETADKEAAQKEAQQRRAAEERDRRQQERDQHLAALADEAQRSRDALTAAMGDLTDAQIRTVRMHAAIICEEPGRIDGHGAHRQSQYDAVATRIARYMVTGEV
jgi:acyl-CoA reductase-like NAD-dependent aldehyde dehydrogenase